jgi:hypothetical protein
MTKPLISYRRIDHLKAIALERGFRNEDAKQFGKLSKTATWEALLKTHGIPLQAVDTVDTTVDTNIQSHDTSGWTNDGSFPVCNFTRPNSSFLDWVDFGQLVALVLASQGCLCWLCQCGDKSILLIYFPQSKSTFKSGQNYELTTVPFWW